MRKPDDPVEEARPDALEAEKVASPEVDPPLTAQHGLGGLRRPPSVLSPEEKFQSELERLLPLAATDPQARQRALVVMSELLRPIPLLIHDRARVWELINAMPAKVRDEGVPRMVGTKASLT